jgi:hypothetical protein
MATETDNTIYGGNGYEFEFPITKKDDATGAKVPATGLVELNGHISATEGGGPIDASLLANLTERSAKPGTYFGRILGSNIEAHLFPAYDGQNVFIVVTDAVGEIQGNVKVKAKANRRI